MALPRYQQRPVQLQEGASVAHRASAQTAQSFVQRVDQFKGMATEQVARASAQQAKLDAEAAFTEKGLKAKLNDDMTVYGQTYTNALQDLHKKKLAIGTSNQMEMIYKENEANPASFEKVSDSYYKATSEMLPEHLKAEYAIDFESNKAHYAGKVQANRIKLDKEADLAATNELITQVNDKSTQSARDGNYKLALYELDKGTKVLQSALENKTITEDKYNKSVNSLKLGVSKANFKGINDRNIETGDLEASQFFIDDFRGSEVEGMNDDQREALADDMQRDLNIEITRQKNELKVKTKFDNEEATNTIYLYNQGEDVDEEVFNRVFESNISPEKREDLILARKNNGAMKIFSSKSLEDQDAEIADLKKQSKTADELKLLKNKEKVYANNQKLIKEDSLSYSEGKAFKEPLETLSLADENLSSKINTRVQQVVASREYTGRRTGFFTKGEVSAIKNELQQMTPEATLGVISKINSLPEQMRADTYKQFGGSFAFAGELSAAGNNIAASTALLGKGADVKLPTNFKADLHSKIANAYGGYNGEYYTQNVKGITDYAKGVMLNGGDVEDIDDLITNSVGKMVKYNKKTTILPQGVDKGKFDTWLDDIVIEGRPGLTKGLNDMTDFLGSGDYQLHHAGHGKYYVYIENDGNGYFARDTDDDTKPFVLDYEATR